MSPVEQMIESIPESAWQVSRRSFMKRLVGGVAAASLLSGSRLASAATLAPLAETAKALDGKEMGDERFWGLVKDQFILKEGLALMNAANLCPSPYPVMETVFNLTRDIDRDASFPNRAKFSEMQETTRKKLEELLGAAPDTIALVRNTSEANNVVSSGIVLKPGDEVVLSDLNHPSNGVAWEVKARRYGFTIKKVHIDVPPKSPDDIIKAFRSALTPATRVLAFTHVASTSSGVLTPAKELCMIARERGIWAHVDGAQSFGALNVNLTDMGCDSYSGSAHKWFMGPKEVGILYVRKERVDALWPSIISVPWRDQIVGARKFEALGQRDDSAIAAVGRTVDFHNMIGKARVEARMRAIATAIKEGITKIPGVQLYASMAPELSAGVIIFKPGTADPRKAFTKLYEKFQIAGASSGGETPGVRLSPHIYNTMAEVDRVLAAVSDIMKNGA